ncbi:hypothetical protein PROFUN_00306 [Planoprotostelium fungivorum]|uniref:Protein arginine N-methyltransferase n=1 Tax=Planoprotostelium fungivorum TaxID=1890364 RepID=A0A2P6NY43_9EUKA|nr:hypothetical protein PROFUN_00306 [Planoprotostelium fungivorum]
MPPKNSNAQVATEEDVSAPQNITDGGNYVENLYFGVELNCVPDLVTQLEEYRREFDFITVPLAHPRNERDMSEGAIVEEEPFARSDMLLSSGQWGSLIIGKISPWIDLDSKDVYNRKNSERVLLQELSWASHLNLPALILPTPTHNSTNYAQVVNRKLQGLMYMNLWMRVPLMSTWQMLHDDETQITFGDNHRATQDPWEHWNTFRTLCEHSDKLCVALELTENVPHERVISRWLGEPVRAVIIPTRIFTTNKSGFPVLSKAHQRVLQMFFKYKIQYILSGPARHKNSFVPYRQYVQFLYSKSPQPTYDESFMTPYLDYLQAPLQPLMDNLESQTYETFERDATKYQLYEDAVFECLTDMKNGGKLEGRTHIVLMVVGAGRGPLVKASLRASVRAGCPLKVYAVEKNPNAIITLKNLRISMNWGDQVTIVDSDMRVWNAPELADVLVSELLGSFGDNELSPECLDGAQRFLKGEPDVWFVRLTQDIEGGISIPASYTSYLAPISSSKLWNEVRAYKEMKHYETPYVVKMHNFYQLGESQECFTFVHPNRDEYIDNQRYINLSFRATQSATVHGLAGYFNSLLYGSVYMSINPANHSPGMFSWFPLYFPLRDPMYVAKDDVITVHMWRNNNRVKVWYEWSIVSPQVSPIHNVGGRSYWIGL